MKPSHQWNRLYHQLPCWKPTNPKILYIFLSQPRGSVNLENGGTYGEYYEGKEEVEEKSKY